MKKGRKIIAEQRPLAAEILHVKRMRVREREREVS